LGGDFFGAGFFPGAELVGGAGGLASAIGDANRRRKATPSEIRQRRLMEGEERMKAPTSRTQRKRVWLEVVLYRGGAKRAMGVAA
jgi:hypothetical protein